MPGSAHSVPGTEVSGTGGASAGMDVMTLAEAVIWVRLPNSLTVPKTSREAPIVGNCSAARPGP